MSLHSYLLHNVLALVAHFRRGLTRLLSLGVGCNLSLGVGCNLSLAVRGTEARIVAEAVCFCMLMSLI